MFDKRKKSAYFYLLPRCRSNNTDQRLSTYGKEFSNPDNRQIGNIPFFFSALSKSPRTTKDDDLKLKSSKVLLPSRVTLFMLGLSVNSEYLGAFFPS